MNYNYYGVCGFFEIISDTLLLRGALSGRALSFLVLGETLIYDFITYYQIVTIERFKKEN
jgi:hypothetical protein